MSRSIVLDSNSLREQKVIRRIIDEDLQVCIPASVFFETYKTSGSIPDMAEANFQHFARIRQRLWVGYDTGSIIQNQNKQRRKVEFADLQSPKDTALVRNMLEYGIKRYHAENELTVRWLIERQRAIPHGLLNIEGCRSAVVGAAEGTICNLPPHLTAKYREKKKSDWIDGPVDQELIKAAVITTRKSLGTIMPRGGFPSSQLNCYLDGNPFLLRWITASYIRRFYLESGMRSANMAPEKFNNERTDVDFCVFSSYAHFAATNDHPNGMLINYINRFLEINSRRKLSPMEIICTNR